MVLLSALTSAGCVSPAPSTESLALAGVSTALSCHRVADRYARLIRQADVASAYGQPLAGAPWFRVLRGWADWPVRTDEERSQWLQAAATLGQTVWRAELRNAGAPALMADMQRCAQQQLPAVSDESQWQAWRQSARFDSEYVTWQRVLGVYPLSRFGLRAGVRAWQQQFLADYGPRPDQAAWSRWQPQVSREVAQRVLAQAPVLPGLAPPSLDQFEVWLRQHAPRLRIQMASSADRPGQPVWREDLAFDVSRPVLHVQLLPGRDRGAAIWQLVFTVWFAGRAPVSSVDPYAGALDGVVWRVMLDAKGRVRMRDSIHSCGCYHLVFPPDAVAAAPGLDEPPLLPEVVAGQARVELALRAVDHMLVDVRPVAERPATGQALPLADYNALLAMPTPSGRSRSLFDARGLVTASARPERWYLWPSGVLSPGAMRIWGRHATAFVGTRHFDDPDLMATLLVDDGR